MKEFLIFTLCLVCCSCGSTKVTTQLVEHVQKDTVYLSSFQYDSIYIFQDKLIDRSCDTLFIKDKSIEYRYKLLRDTLKVVQRDSIPYEVTITRVKEITRPLTFYDRICRACFWFMAGGVCLLLFRRLKSLWRIR